MPAMLISHFGWPGLSWEHSLPNPAPVCAFSLCFVEVCVVRIFAFDKFILYWPLNIIIYFGML